MSLKHKPIQSGFHPDPDLLSAIRSSASDGTVDCASAFNLSHSLGIAYNDLGSYLDYCNIRLKRCQIGLFGYGKGNKLITRTDTVDATLSDRIDTLIRDGILSCSNVFLIASEFGISKVDVGNACETKGIKIKQCRFGAF